MDRLHRNRTTDLLYVVLALFLGDELVIREDVPDRIQGRGGEIHRFVWTACDNLFRTAARIKPLQKSDSHLFCVAQHRYLGRPLCVDGIPLRRFDPVIEIHMNNKLVRHAVHNQHSLVRLANSLIKEANRSFPALADCVASDEYCKAKVLYGITFIHRGVERFGFTTYPIESKPGYRFLAWYLRNIFRMTNPNARSLFASRPEIFRPKIVAISKQRLLQQYGSQTRMNV